MSESQKQLIQVLFLRKLIRNSQQYYSDRVFAKFGIGVMKYEISSNLKLIHVNNISSILKDSKITYKVKQNNFESNQINIYNHIFRSQIEQLGDNILIISGGYQDLFKRFTIHETNKKNKEFAMINKRQFHRTRFNQKSLIYIISGFLHEKDQNYDVPNCEVFNLKTNTFGEICPINCSVYWFGCDQYDSKLYVFGGITVRNKMYKDIIQVYDYQ